MLTTSNQTSQAEVRRELLKRWIKDYFDDSQARFIEHCADRGHDINQGELSSLLKNKSFGEKKARSLEAAAGMPDRHLEGYGMSRPIQRPLIAAEPVIAFPSRKLDKWTAEALEIFSKLDTAQKAACVVQLRAYVAAVGPPRVGQAL